jgi:hypothetical protein
MINATFLKEERYLIRKSDRRIHELDDRGRGAADGCQCGTKTRQHENIKYVIRI